MDELDEDIKFCKAVLNRHHFTDEERFKLVSILQRYVFLKEIRNRQTKKAN